MYMCFSCSFFVSFFFLFSLLFCFILVCLLEGMELEGWGDGEKGAGAVRIYCMKTLFSIKSKIKGYNVNNKMKF